MLYLLKYNTFKIYFILIFSGSIPLGLYLIMSSNPIPIIIPCHRVIGKNGSLTGYAGGLDRKTRLLALEHSFMHEQNY